MALGNAVAAARAADVVVVGAGIAGLTAARALHAHGLDVHIVEAADDVGGRVRTDRVDGFRLDRGFHTLNTAYSEPRRWLDLAKLELRPVGRDVVVYAEGAQHRLDWDLAGVDGAQAALGSEPTPAAVGRPNDAARLREMLTRLGSMSTDSILGGPDLQAYTALRSRGLSPRVIERLLLPLLTGFFLDPYLETSSRAMDLALRAFVRGREWLPAYGIAAVPAQVAAHLPADSIHLGLAATEIATNHVVTTSGPIATRATIVATDPRTAAGLLPGLTLPIMHGALALYFAAALSPLAEPLLVLDGESGQEAGRVVSSMVVSEAVPDFSPDDRALIVATAVRPAAPHRLDLVAAVRDRLGTLYGTDSSDWTHLATYEIPDAAPAMLAPLNPRRPVRIASGLYVCGDHRATSSLQGAMLSGRRAAKALIDDFGLRA